MDDNKIYLHATELLINSVVIVFNIAGKYKEIELSELIDSYNEYRNLKINIDWFKSTVDTLKDSLDKLEFNNDTNN